MLEHQPPPPYMYTQSCFGCKLLGNELLGEGLPSASAFIVLYTWIYICQGTMLTYDVGFKDTSCLFFLLCINFFNNMGHLCLGLSIL